MYFGMISNKIAKKMKKIHVELLFLGLKKGGGASIQGNTVYYFLSYAQTNLQASTK